jgi:hypothetical protein
MSHTTLPGEQFTLNRRALARALNADSDEDRCGLARFGDSPAEQIAGAVTEAEVTGALKAPATVALYVVKATPNDVILTVRERYDVALPGPTVRKQLGLPDERQVASWPIESGWLTDGQADTFGALCDTLDEVCKAANDLLPSLQATRDGEQQLIDLAERPLSVITRTSPSRLATRVSAVGDLTDYDADLTKSLWPLLISALEGHTATEEWDGERQRTLLVRPGAQKYLARQLCDHSAELIRDAKATPTELPEPDNGFAPYLR